MLFCFLTTIAYAQNIVEIKTQKDLSAFRERVNNGEQTLNATLMADIRIPEKWVGIGTYTSEYKGNFDGGGYTITGLSGNAGLFDVIGDGAKISSLQISGANIEGVNNVGILASIIQAGAVINSVFIERSKVKGNTAVGGFAGVLHGEAHNVIFENSSVIGVTQVGGIAGNMTGTIKYAWITGISYVQGKQYVGGIVGNMMKGSVLGSSFVVEVTVGNTIKGESFVGGVAGFNGGLIAANVVRNHNISGGNNYFGGIAGLNNSLDGSAKIIGNFVENGIEKKGSTQHIIAGLTTPNSLFSNYLIRVYDFQQEAQEGSKIIDMIDLNVLVEINNTLASNKIPYAFNIDGVVETVSDEQLSEKHEELHPTHLEIATLDDLMKFANQVNTGNTTLSAKLMDNISLEGVKWTPIGSEERPYISTFDGNGKTISDLTIKGYDYGVGLFGYVGGDLKNKTVIKNLSVENVNLYGMAAVGAVAGRAGPNTLIDNVTTNGIVMGERGVAGVVGSTDRAEVRYAKNYAHVQGEQTSTEYIGGIVGYAIDTKIYATYNAGKITGDTNGICATGGIVGFLDTSLEYEEKDDYSYVMASINEGSILSDTYVGGIVGDVMDGLVIGNVNFGSVRGYERDIGGIVGQNQGKMTLDANLNFGSVSGGSSMKNRVGVIHKFTYGENYHASINGATSYGTDDTGMYFWLDNMQEVYEVLPEVNKAIKEYADFQYIIPSIKGLAPRVDAIDYLPIATEKEVSVVMSHIAIYTEADLIQLKEFVEKGITKINATLQNDITLTKLWKPIGTAEHAYAGTFSGGGYSISGLKIKEKGDNVGLFATLKGNVSNLIIKSPDVEGADNVGALAGIATGTIESINVEGGKVTGSSHVGGVVGMLEGYIYSTKNSSNVTGYSSVGGIAGESKNGLYFDSNSGNIKGETNVGGVVGYGTSINTSYNTGDVTGDNVVGGIAGTLVYAVDSSYNTGKVSATQTVGGLVGILSEASVARSYNLGDVTAIESQAGGIAGIAIRSSDMQNIWGVYSSAKVTAESKAGGIVGELINSYDELQGYFADAYYISTNDIGTNHSGIARLTAKEELNDKIDVMNIAANKLVGYSEAYDINANAYFAKSNIAGLVTPIIIEGNEVDGEGEYIYFEIYSEQDLLNFKSEFEQLGHINYYEVVLVDNITLTKPWVPVALAFDGFFDGNGKTISGLVIKSADDNVGFFKQLSYDATVMNVTFKSPMVEGGNNVGVIAGSIAESGAQRITNVKIDGGEVKGKSNVSAFVGENSETLVIENSNFATKITIVE